MFTVGDKVKVVRKPSKQECKNADDCACHAGETGTVCAITQDGKSGKIEKVSVDAFPGTSSWCSVFPVGIVELVEGVGMFNVGDKVKLRDYSKYSDWRSHGGETGEIIDNQYATGVYPIRIKWGSGNTSCSPVENLILVTKQGGEKTVDETKLMGATVETSYNPPNMVKRGKIIAILPKEKEACNRFLVEFEENVGGHDGATEMTGNQPAGRSGHCYWCPKEKLTFVTVRRRRRVKVHQINGKRIVERDFFDELRMCYALNHYTVIVGETGTGKSFAVEFLAKKLGVPFTRVSFDLATPIRELLGTLKLVSKDGATVTEFAKGILLNALINPGIILGDELNSADPAKMFLLHQITDTRKIYIKEQGETYEMHPECRFFATINPSDRRYTGTLKLNLAMVNRFHILHAPPFTKRELEAIVPAFRYKTELLKFYEEIRKLIEKQQPPFEFSVRNVERIISIYKAGAALKTALEIGFLNQALCFGEKQDYDACLQIAMAVFGKEVMGAAK